VTQETRVDTFILQNEVGMRPIERDSLRIHDIFVKEEKVPDAGFSGTVVFTPIEVRHLEDFAASLQPSLLPDRRDPLRRIVSGGNRRNGHTMDGINPWESFFDAHAPFYEDNLFTKNTVREVDFLLEELSLKTGASILDVGCGTGRHSIELAGRGFDVTGLDLSAEMLAQAARGAETAGVDVNWVHSDAARFAFPDRFDGAICLCEGAFGLLGPADDPVGQPLSILNNISRSLRPDARAMFTVLNAASMLRRYTNEDVAAGRFDPVTLVERSSLAPREGLPPVPVRERGFVPTELTLLLRLAGMSVLDIWGGTAGDWGRRPLDLDEIEIMLVARKAGNAVSPYDSDGSF
jgi:SAM-dependent methyltransferase